MYEHGALSRRRLAELLLDDATELFLSRLQVYAVMNDMPEDEDGMIETDAFARKAAAEISAMFDPALVRQRLVLMQRAEVTPVELLGGLDRAQLEEELMRVRSPSFLDPRLEVCA